jgi:hypothetical protein
LKKGKDGKVIAKARCSYLSSEIGIPGPTIETFEVAEECNGTDTYMGLHLSSTCGSISEMSSNQLVAENSMTQKALKTNIMVVLVAPL